MKNKKRFGILSLLLATGLILGGCVTKKDSSQGTSSSGSQTSASSSDSSASESSSSPSSSSSQPVTKYTVTFKVDGVTVQTSEVEEGGFASYTGDTPTKAPDAEAPRYRFKGWDKDPATTPITENTEFNAVFAVYATQIKVGDFEEFTSDADLNDNGWFALGYNGGWTKETAASVALSTNAAQGEKALRLDAWANTNDYKISREFAPNELNKSVNALRFSLMAPRGFTFKVLLQGSVDIDGTPTAAYFSHQLTIPSSEYTDYVIPFDSPSWALWGQAGQSMVAVADYIGVHQDDVLGLVTSMEFYLKGDDGTGGQKYIAFLDNVTFDTLDNPQLSANHNYSFFDTYTGTTASGHVVKLEIGESGAATARVIDLETPIEIPGTVTDDGGQVQFKSADNGQSLTFNCRVTDGGQLLQFVSATSADAGMQADVANMDLLAVQTVDNYEQYTSDGKSYYQGNKDMSQRSGCRGNYYSEYYSGGTSDVETFGGNGWVLMGGSGDQLKLKSDNAGHNGSKNYVCMKNSATYGMRYMQWGLFEGTSEQHTYRGAKLGFWIKTNGKIPAIKVSMYSQTKPRNATKDQQVRSMTITDAAAAQIGTWTHYELDLNPKLTYYGFLVFMEKNNSADAYLYMDDIEVYTADPYAHYVAPEPDKALVSGMHFQAKIGGLVNAMIDIDDNSHATLAIPGFGAEVAGTFALDGDDATFTFGTAVYTATIAENYSGLTFKSVTGSGDLLPYLNNLSFAAIDFAETAEFYENSGKMYYESNLDESTISGARGAYYCDRYTGSGSTPVGGDGWALMGGSGDQIELDKSDAVEGSQSITFKRSNGASLRYLQWELYKGTAKARTGVTKFRFFLKNPAANEMHVKIWVYKVQQITPSTQGNRVEKEITMSASQGWTQYEVNLNPNETYYGYGIYTFKGDSNAYVKLDAAHFAGPQNDPMLAFYAKNGLALSGTITAGSATMTFGTNNNVTLTCAALGGDLAGTYEMAMGVQQTITITTSMGTITGTYGVDGSGTVTLQITEVTGDLAAGVNVGATLSNS